MILQHNLLAQNTSRNLNMTTNRVAKASERLSSGYKVNRAADDAAGLTISEHMRAQIRGLNRASANAQDGISMLQTAEGALNEVHDILHRMTELSVQAANDTNTAADRSALQKEMNHLRTEINKISDSTLFNTRHVLKVPQLIEIDGESFSNASMDNSYNITTAGGSQRNVYGIGMNFGKLDETNIQDLIGKSFTASCTDSCDQIFTFEFTDATSSSATISGLDLTVSIGINDPNINTGQDVINEIMNQVTLQQTTPPFDGYVASNTTGDLFIGHANGIAAEGDKLILYSIDGGPPYQPGMGLLQASAMYNEEETIHFQIGAQEGEGMEYIIRTINTTTLGLDEMDLSSFESAGKCLTAIDKAVTKVSDYRSYLGAVQNRLEHAIANNDQTAENTQAAESLIRDADMADEMVEYSAAKIIEQAGQAMLAQANTMNSQVLTLLR